MSTTITYKGETLATVSNATKTLTTQGKYLEDNITLTDVSGSAPILQTKSVSITPSTTAQSQAVTPDAGYDGLDEVDISVAAMPSGSATTPATSITAPPTLSVQNSTGIVTATINKTQSVTPSVSAGYVSSGTAGNITVSGSNTLQLNTQAATTITPSTQVQTAVPSGRFTTGAVTVAAIPTGSAGTPTATKSAVTNHSVSVTPSVTNTTGYITGGTKTGTAVSVSASELVSGTVNITSSGNTDVTNYATASVASGGATASATKGTVSNHSITVTPSVTKTAGYITAGTTSGTAVTVSASELVSGSETKTANGTYDVTNLAEIVVDVQGGGGGGVQIGKTTKTLASSASSIQFTGLSGNPTSFVVTSAEDIATNTSGVTAVVFDGTLLHGQTMTTQVTADTGFTKSYSNGTLTITATSASFQAVEYKLVYTYGGSASDIETADVQVGSGATSITFPVTGRPAYWSCIFKSDFSTSSGYQRVIGVVNDGSSIYGLAMDSSAHAASSWTATYSGGNLTISSQSTNVGGYFHQPGYYQLTYYVDESAPQYQSKTVTPTTSQQVVTPDSGYDALDQVTVNAIPSEYIIPSGNLAITQNGNNIDVAQYATVSVNVSGGGGSVQYDTKTATASNYPTSLAFTSMKGEPKAFVVRLNAQVSSSGSTTYYYIVDVSHFGTTTHGNCFRIGSTRRVDNITSGYSYSYSNGTLTITSSASSRSASPGAFYNGSYELLYCY